MDWRPTGDNVIWTNEDSIYWQILVSFGLDEETFKTGSFSDVTHVA